MAGSSWQYEPKMLILTRKTGQSFKIQTQATPNPGTDVGKLLGDLAIHIVVTQVRGKQVKPDIHSHPDLLILREELDSKPRKKNEKPSD